jgi:hypothetical protein
VAGSFYPREQAELAATVEALMSRASRSRESGLIGVIAPHAGYMYSGPVAASAFASLGTQVRVFERVLLIGPPHYVPVHGIAAPKQFEGKSRIGQYGDKLMEGDYHVGQILDALKEFGVDDNTLLVFASDNGPQGETARKMGNEGTPDMGNSGPFRGELGETTEGSIRTFCLVRWPGNVKPGTSSYAMFSIMDFFPTFARLIGSKIPTDRPIDGVDQTDVLFGKSETGNRDSLLTFIGADMVAVRWKQWRMYFTDVHPTGVGPQREPSMFSASAPMAGYPKIYNIEMDPHEDLQVGALFGWTAGDALARGREVQGNTQEVSQPACGQPDAILMEAIVARFEAPVTRTRGWSERPLLARNGDWRQWPPSQLWLYRADGWSGREYTHHATGMITNSRTA